MSAPEASDRVRVEWRNRIAAEYGSAAITQHFVLWLIQLGASPDLIDDGLAIVKDELVHSGLSAEVYTDAGGDEPPAIDRAGLGLPRRDVALELDVLRATLQIYCLNETVAVPLFSHLRAGATVPSARKALDRILRDEVRHRDFGWDCLDWFLTTPLADRLPALVEAELPRLFAHLHESYGSRDDGGVTDDDRTWGLAPPHEYADILDETFTRDYLPRFAARGVDAAPAWQARRPA
ncbi:MAG: ferritin-like domain-containing protein [Kofleriaceae bacterium]|nr:ferritin-like domain-containing protein [Kofleriaceae bacterium]MCL4225385.1 ferritin-like domain-containing protein [Myxococcales bacterium]